MSVKFGLALLALSYLTAASDPDCEELIKPLEDRNQVTGKWIFHVGTSDTEEHLNELRTMNSSGIEISPIPGSDDMTLRWGDRMDGKCHTGSVNSTFTGNSTKVTFHFNASDHEHVGMHLVACPDCMLWTDTVIKAGGGNSKNLYLFTRTGKLDDPYLEVFKKQAACLNFPLGFHFGEITDMCPYEKAAATDVKEEEQ